MAIFVSGLGASASQHRHNVYMAAGDVAHGLKDAAKALYQGDCIKALEDILYTERKLQTLYVESQSFGTWRQQNKRITEGERYGFWPSGMARGRASIQKYDEYQTKNVENFKKKCMR